MSNFNTYSKYYDLLYKEKDYKNECGYVIDLLKHYSPSAKAILELGSGSGEHAVHLCAKGYEVTGIDRSAEMVSISESKNIKGFNGIVGDVSSFKLEDKFDAAVALFHVISYLTDNQSLIKCFEQTGQHLKENGLFIFDVWYTPAVYTLLPETRIKRLEDDTISVTRIAEPIIDYINNIVEVNYEVAIKNKTTDSVETLKEKHPMRHFGIPEIELLAIQTGFEIIKVEEFANGNVPSEKTWGVCFVLKQK